MSHNFSNIVSFEMGGNPLLSQIKTIKQKKRVDKDVTHVQIDKYTLYCFSSLAKKGTKHSAHFEFFFFNTTEF